MDFFSLHKQTLCRPMLFTYFLHTQVKSGKSYQNKVVSFGLKRAYMNEHPTRVVQIALIF